MALSGRIQRLVWAGILGISGSFLYLVIATFLSYLPIENGFVMKNGMLLGGDFITFYIAGKLYSIDPANLYDLLRQKELRTLTLGISSSALNGELPFVYPPLIAVAFSFLAHFPFSNAYTIWAIFALCVSLFSLFAVLRQLGLSQIGFVSAVIIVFGGFLPFSMNTILGGQLSWIGFSLVCWIFLALQADRPFIAGLLMSLSYYKPPLFLLALIVLFCTQGPAFFSGFSLGGAILIILTIWAVGVSGLINYISLVSRYTYGQKLFEDVELPPSEGAGIFALVTTFSPNMTLTLTLFGAVFIFTIFILVWYRFTPSVNSWYVWYATVWIASVGLSLQCIRYDLAIIFLPLFLIFLVLKHVPIMCSALISAGLIGFYLEWLFRSREYLGSTVNLSSFIFIYLLINLLFLMIYITRSKLKC